MDADATPVLRGERVVLRPVAEADLGDPGGHPPRARGRRLVGRLHRGAGAGGAARPTPAGRSRSTAPRPGWLTATEETEPDYRHVGFDIFLATAVQGRGLGREALGLAVRHFAARGHHRFTIDPALANERAIRSYAAVGFRPVGVMRAYERGRDGTWHDNLLMDLLVRDLEAPPAPPREAPPG